MNPKNADDIPCVVALSTRLVYSDEQRYVEVAKNGVIGIGTGKWPGSDALPDKAALKI